MKILFQNTTQIWIDWRTPCRRYSVEFFYKFDFFLIHKTISSFFVVLFYCCCCLIAVVLLLLWLFNSIINHVTYESITWKILSKGDIVLAWGKMRRSGLVEPWCCADISMNNLYWINTHSHTIGQVIAINCSNHWKAPFKWVMRTRIWRDWYQLGLVSPPPCQRIEALIEFCGVWTADAQHERNVYFCVREEERGTERERETSGNRSTHCFM